MSYTSIGESTIGSIFFVASQVPAITNALPDLNKEESDNIVINLNDAFSGAEGYSLSVSPSGSNLSLNGSIISGFLTSESANSSPYTVTVTASNLAGKTQQVFTLAIADTIPTEDTSSFYNSLKKVSSKLLSKYGKNVTFEHIKEGIYNPVTGEETNSSIMEITGKGILITGKNFQMKSTSISDSSGFLLFEAVTYKPKPGDRVLINGVRMKVISSEVLIPSNTTLIYQIKLGVCGEVL